MHCYRTTYEAVFLAIVLLFFLLLETSLINAGALEKNQAAIRSTVERIRLITALPPKRGQQIRDVHAKAVLDLGREAAPFLVQKLTDPTPTQLIYLFRYETADIALRLLQEIYEPSNWPFPDGSEAVPQKYGDYRDYVEFVHSPGARQRLKESWQSYIEFK